MWCSIAPDRRRFSQTWSSAAHTHTLTCTHKIHTDSRLFFIPLPKKLNTFKPKSNESPCIHTNTLAHTFLFMHNALWTSQTLHKLDTNASEWLICTCTHWPMHTWFLLQAHVVVVVHSSGEIPQTTLPSAGHRGESSSMRRLFSNISSAVFLLF